MGTGKAPIAEITKNYGEPALEEEDYEVDEYMRTEEEIELYRQLYALRPDGGTA